MDKKIEIFIKKIKDDYDCLDYIEQYLIALDCGFNILHLTPEEVKYINNRLAERD
jgi:hypothetical protein